MRWYGLVLGALCAPMIATPAAARERIAMLVVQQGGPSMASDLTVRDRLAARGFTVRLADQSADPLTAREAALVVISATVSAKSVKPGWRTRPSSSTTFRAWRCRWSPGKTTCSTISP